MRGLSKTVSRHDHDGREKSKHFPAASRIRNPTGFHGPEKRAFRPPIDARLTFPPFPFHSRTPRWEPEPPCPGSYLNESFRDGFTHERQEPAAPRRRSRKATLHRRSASFRREVPNRTGRSRKRFPGEWRKFFPGNGQERIHTFRGSCGLRRTGWDTAAP